MSRRLIPAWRRWGPLGALPVVCLFLFAFSAEANGIYRNGIGARAMSLGGADVAWAEDALGPMAANPAALASLTSPTVIDMGVVTVIPSGRFTNRANDDGELRSDTHTFPEAAFAIRLGTSPVTLGFGVFPEAALIGHWRYVDTPGGVGGTTYGLLRHESGIVVLRSALGLGLALGPNVSLGGSLGLVYNKNTLETAYVFQTQPTLKGFKTLLDLETDGVGWGGNVGVLFRPHENVQLGLNYKSRTVVHSHGDASGNIGAQFATLGLPLRPDFHYDAEVVNTFPQMLTGGVSWQVSPPWRLTFQVDWIDWSDAFDQLPIKLTNGNNADINSVVGSDSLDDTVPLKWRDRLVYRAGAEYAASSNLRLRAGYAYGKSPVPNSTLLPLTAVIMEHTVTTGVGYQLGHVQLDFAYQLDVPKTRRVGASELRAGEYSDSRTEVEVHWIGITASIRF